MRRFVFLLAVLLPLAARAEERIDLHTRPNVIAATAITPVAMPWLWWPVPKAVSDPTTAITPATTSR